MPASSEVSPKQSSVNPATILTRDDLRRMIKEYGGTFHGPRVEHLSMEEQTFWRFMDAVIIRSRAVDRPISPNSWRSAGRRRTKPNGGRQRTRI